MGTFVAGYCTMASMRLKLSFKENLTDVTRVLPFPMSFVQGAMHFA